MPTASLPIRGLLLGALLATGCAQPADLPRSLYANGLDSLEHVIARSGVAVDTEAHVEGGASLRIDARGPITIQLAEVPLDQLEQAVLQYGARLRSRDLEGQAYLEMWVRVPGKGEFFSRALQAPLRGTNEWTSQETPFFLEAGQRANLAKLNVVVDGRGTLWIDDLGLTVASR